MPFKTPIVPRRRLKILLLLVLMGMLLFATRPASAHPLGNFTVNRYSRLTVGQSQIDLFYVVDMAEIPTFQQWDRLDTDGSGLVSEAEATSYLAQFSDEIAANLNLVVNGKRLDLAVQNSRLTTPPGQAELATLRIELELLATMPAADGWAIDYADNNFGDRLGWQEVIVESAGDTKLSGSTVPNQDISDALRSYPDAQLKSPPAVNSATLQAIPGAGAFAMAADSESATTGVEASRFSDDRFTELISFDALTPRLVVIAILLSFGLGALHAFSPGHGKTIVGAYLVGSRGTPKHALFLGLTTTVTHTAGVFGFGLLILFASRFILPEQLYPWLGVMSGLLIVAIGISLVRSHIRRARAIDTSAEEHDEGYHTHFGIGHTHSPQEPGWRNLLALGVSGGIIPCPSALVVLLSAVALDRVGFGLLLIVMFSLGLASVLTLLGITFVYAGRVFERSTTQHRRLLAALPAASALFVTIAGIGITAQALFQLGLFA